VRMIGAASTLQLEDRQGEVGWFGGSVVVVFVLLGVWLAVWSWRVGRARRRSAAAYWAHRDRQRALSAIVERRDR
jgi:hypothetical protein